MNRLIRQARKKVRKFRYNFLDDFVFIHINKTGGSSVEQALGIPLEHKTALEKIGEIGEKRWDKKLSFTIVRNPWDKVVSHYHYRIKTNQTNLGDNPIGFKKWVKLAYGNQDKFYYNNPKMFMPQIDWISDQSGKILVDKVIRFESLNSEFNEILKIIGRKANLPHVKSSNRGAYQDYYCQETREIVSNWFRQDIDRFGYSFD